MKNRILISTAVVLSASLFLVSCSSNSSSQKEINVRHKEFVDETEDDDNDPDLIETVPTTESSEEEKITPEPTEPEDEFVKVGIINFDPNESGYRLANDKDMKEMFTEVNGYDACFFYSMKNDEMISAAECFILDNVDYLVICAADSSGWDEVLQSARDEGIKVILFDIDIDVDEDLYEALVVTDMEKEGQLAVEWLDTQELPEYNILHLQGVLGSTAQISRGNPLDLKAESDADWNITLEETAGWDAESAKKIVAQAIDDGVEFNVIYADNDNMAKGAVAALDEANITHGIEGEVMIVSFDCAQYAMEEVLMGNWNCEVQCSPFMASYIDDIIRNGTFEKTVIVEDQVFDAATITYDDVDKYGL